MQLQAVIGNAISHFRGEELRHRHFGTAIPPAIEYISRIIRQLPSRFQLSSEISKTMRYDLMVEESLTKSPAFSRIPQRVFQGLLRRTDCHTRRNQALILEVPHDVIKALALFADQILPSDANILEYQFARIRAMITKLLHLFRQPEARGITHDNEHGNASLSFVFLRFSGNTEHIGMDRIGDENLSPVQYVRIAITDRGGLNAGHI